MNKVYFACLYVVHTDAQSIPYYSKYLKKKMKKNVRGLEV